MGGSVDTNAPTQSQVYRATRWNVAASAFGQGGRLLVFLLLARLLAPEDFGLMAMALVVVGFLNIIRNLGTGPAVIQRTTLSSELLDSVFWLNIAAGMLLALLVLMLAPAVSAGFAEPRLTPVLQVLAAGFLITTAGTLPRALLHRRLSFHWVAVAEIGAMLVYAAVALPLALLGYGVWSLVAATLSSDLAATASSWIGARWRPRARCDAASLASIWKFSANLTLSQIVSYFLWQSDRIIIGRFLGAGDLGVYAIAHRLLGFAVLFLVPQLHAVLFPALARSSDAGIRSGFARAQRGIAMVVFPLVIGLSAVGPTFVHAFLGAEWALAAVLIPILGVRYVAEAILQGVGVLYQVKARTDLLLAWQLGSGAVFVTSYLAGLPWGLVGVATAQSMAIVALTYPGFAIPLRLIGQKVIEMARDLTPYMLANGVMLAATLAYLTVSEARGGDAWSVLAGAVLAGGVSYALATYLLRPAALTDLQGLLRR